jgi:hypothetical protein
MCSSNTCASYNYSSVSAATSAGAKTYASCCRGNALVYKALSCNSGYTLSSGNCSKSSSSSTTTYAITIANVSCSGGTLTSSGTTYTCTTTSSSTTSVTFGVTVVINNSNYRLTVSNGCNGGSTSTTSSNVSTLSLSRQRGTTCTLSYSSPDYSAAGVKTVTLVAKSG